jgi:transcription termination factor Rho
MNERRRPHRRGRGPRPFNRPNAADQNGEPNPYREAPEGASTDGGGGGPGEGAAPATGGGAEEGGSSAAQPSAGQASPAPVAAPPQPSGPQSGAPSAPPHGGNGRRPQQQGGPDRDRQGGRRNRGRGAPAGGNPRREHQERAPVAPIVADGETTGWFDLARDGGFIRRASSSYLAEPGDAFVPPAVVRQYGLRRGDAVTGTVGRDQRGRLTMVEVVRINDGDPAEAARRPEFASLTAAYPERKLTLETGRPAKAGPELTRRAIDLIAPIGYGQRALIVAPARAGKTMLLQAITEGVARNHANAVLLILLVDERPEEVSEAISWGVGEVIASSFDQPAERHVDVTEIVLERARRLVEAGKDVVIVLDSLTRMARAHNTAERGTGRTLSGGLDAQAMAKPKAFFGSARAVDPRAGGGSLTIIATALVETGSRMDDVIFEEFKGTGNCEIKLDRSLAEKRIFPAFDIATSGTRREEKLFRPDQLDAVYTLRRGLQQMPPQAAMEWLIKRIGATPNNDALLSGL